MNATAVNTILHFDPEDTGKHDLADAVRLVDQGADGAPFLTGFSQEAPDPNLMLFRRVLKIARALAGITACPIEDHPQKDVRKFGVAEGSSYFNRHYFQLKFFADQVLRLLIEDKLARDDKNIRLVINGPGFDEPLSFISRFVRAFREEDNIQQWGDLSKWKVQIALPEINLPVLLEFFNRFNGRTPIGLDIEKDTNDSLSALQDDSWRDNIEVFGVYGDPCDPALFPYFRDHFQPDVIFMNATFDHLDHIAAEKVARLYSGLGAIVVGDKKYDSPVVHFTSNHEVSIQRSPLNMPSYTNYAVAIPNRLLPSWREINGVNQTDLAQEAKREQQVRILWLSNDSNSKTLTNMSLSVACWANKNPILRKPEITSLTSDEFRNATAVKRALQHGACNVIFVDTDNFDSEYGPYVQELLNLTNEFKIPIYLVDPVEFDSPVPRLNEINSQALRNEHEVTAMMEKLLVAQGVLADQEADLKSQVPDSLKELNIFTGREEYFYFFQYSRLRPRNDLLGVKGVLSRSVKGTDPIDVKCLRELPVVAPREFKIAWMKLVDKLEQDQTDLTLLSDFEIGFDVHLYNIMEEVEILATIDLELGVCTEAEPDGLRAFLDLLWRGGGCGSETRYEALTYLDREFGRERKSINALLDDSNNNSYTELFNGVIRNVVSIYGSIHDKIVGVGLRYQQAGTQKELACEGVLSDSQTAQVPESLRELQIFTGTGQYFHFLTRGDLDPVKELFAIKRCIAQEHSHQPAYMGEDLDSPAIAPKGFQTAWSDFIDQLRKQSMIFKSKSETGRDLFFDLLDYLKAVEVFATIDQEFETLSQANPADVKTFLDLPWGASCCATHTRYQGLEKYLNKQYWRFMLRFGACLGENNRGPYAEPFNKVILETLPLLHSIYGKMNTVGKLYREAEAKKTVLRSN